MGTNQHKKSRKSAAPQQAVAIKDPPTQGPPAAVPYVSPPRCNTTRPNDESGDNTPPWKKRLEVVTVFIALGLLIVNIRQMRATQDSAAAATSAAQSAKDQIVIGQRPWVKIKQRILAPLQFNIGARASGKSVAMMAVEDTIENVGQTVALNVTSWEDLVPLDPYGSTATAKKRQAEICDKRRYPPPTGQYGNTLFPHDPFVQNSKIGPTMETIRAAAERNPGELHGKVGLVLAGCVSYRSSFEAGSTPSHQTRFIYWLARPAEDIGILPYVFPQGTVGELQLVTMYQDFTAD